jgi:holo-[acyl-carrier protein] synthase
VIVGVGIDVVDVERFMKTLERTPGLRDRVFTEKEAAKPPASLAARFAAKEALIKALGDVPGFRWLDVEVKRDQHGDPSFVLRNAVAGLLTVRGITTVHLSMSHDAGVAFAFVVAERTAS